MLADKPIHLYAGNYIQIHVAFPKNNIYFNHFPAL